MVNLNKISCFNPFIACYIRLNWEVKFCCNMKWSIWNINKQNDFLKIWNSKKAIEIRKQMINWQLPNECEFCINENKIWFKWEQNFRQRKVDFFKSNFEDKDEFVTLKSDFSKIWIFSLNFSNLCNFSCIMCFPWRSSSRKKLWEILWEQKYGKIDLSKKINLLFSKNIDKLKNLKRIFIKWWEPLIHKEQYIFLDWLIKNNLSKNIEINYSTNLSVLPWINWYKYLLPKWYNNVFDLRNKFKNINLDISCDWYWNVYEKIRINWKWNNFIENIKSLKNQNFVKFSFHIVVQIDNLIDIMKLLKFCYKNKIEVWLYMLRTPEYFNITIISTKLKLKIKEKYDKFIEDNHNNLFFKNSLEQIEKFMFSEKKNPKMFQKYLEVKKKINN